MPEMKRPRARKGTLPRLIATLFRFYPGLATGVVICTVFTAIVSSIPSYFMQNVFAILGEVDYIVENTDEISASIEKTTSLMKEKNVCDAKSAIKLMEF